jgi:hypothetical protein
MKRGAILAVALLALSACGGQRTALDRDESEVLAWYVEDLAHGLPRVASELQRPDGSEGMAAAAAWLSGPTPPSEMLRRQQRWAALRALCHDRALAIDAEGQLRARDDRRTTAQLAAQENLARDTLGQVLLSLGRLRPGSPEALRLTGFLTEARIHHARRAGAPPWTEPQPADLSTPAVLSASSSTAAATTSTSATATWPAPGL